MQKRTRALRFDAKTRKRIMDRDGGCIFCRTLYHLPAEPQYIFDIMHIVNRSQGGLGIEQNGVVGCRYHHMMLDNGNEGLREEMQQIIQRYMKRFYPGWDRKALVYKNSFRAPN